MSTSNSSAGMSASPSGVKYTGMPPTSWDNKADPKDITWGPPFASNPARATAFRAEIDKWIKQPFDIDERWRARAKQELNEDPARMRGQVDKLRGIISGVRGLHSRMDDHFLLAFLRSKRHEVDPALKSLMKYYRMRKLNAAFFELCLPSTHPEVYDTQVLNILDGYDKLGRPICYFTADFSPNDITNLHIVQLLVHTLDFLVIDPRAQISGLTILVNLEKQSMAHTKLITVKFLKLMLQIFQGSFPVRMKLIFLCHGSFLFRATYSVLKPFIPQKFKDRIFILSSEVKVMHNHISPEILPPVLMGVGNPPRRNLLAERIHLVEDLIREWHAYGYEDGADMGRAPSMQFDDEEEPPLAMTDDELQRRITAEAMESTGRKGSKKSK